MHRRFTSQTVIFRHPFRLAGFSHDEAAGVYTIEVEQEALDSLTLVAWRHIATTMQLRRDGALEFVPVDPAELTQAWARDQHPDPAASP